MPNPLHTARIYTLADLEACCRRWREFGATDDTKVSIAKDFALDVIGTLEEHHSGGARPITLDQFHDANALRERELDALRAFHDFFLNHCEVLFFHFGWPVIDLYNAAFRFRHNITYLDDPEG